MRRSLIIARVCLIAGSVLVWGASGAQSVPHQHQTMNEAQKKRQAFLFMGLKMFVEVSSAETKGATAVVRVFVPAGAGAAPHVHSREDEVFTIVRGHYRFRHGDEEIDAPAGTTIFLPRGELHTFRNIGPEPGEHVLTLIPGGLEKLFREISAADLQMPRDKARLAEMAAKYGVRFLPPEALPLSASH